jgi:hypothetical protein
MDADFSKQFDIDCAQVVADAAVRLEQPPQTTADMLALMHRVARASWLRGAKWMNELARSNIQSVMREG